MFYIVLAYNSSQFNLFLEDKYCVWKPWFILVISSPQGEGKRYVIWHVQTCSTYPERLAAPGRGEIFFPSAFPILRVFSLYYLWCLHVLGGKIFLCYACSTGRIYFWLLLNCISLYLVLRKALQFNWRSSTKKNVSLRILEHIALSFTWHQQKRLKPKKQQHLRKCSCSRRILCFWIAPKGISIVVG